MKLNVVHSVRFKSGETTGTVLSPRADVYSSTSDK